METLSIGRKSRKNRVRGLLTPRFLLGLLLIFFGVTFTLHRSGIIEHPWDVLKFWPTILILGGLGKLIWPGSASGGRTSGFLLAGFGTLLLLSQLGLLPFDFWDFFWPALLIVIGFRMLMRSSQGSPLVYDDEQGGSASAGGSPDETVQAIAVLGGSTRRSTSSNFRGGDLVALMGGCDIDLRRARIQGEPAVIDAFAFWGGIEVRVPEDWTVTVEGLALIGAYEDSTHTQADVGPKQELIVKGFAIMGGVEIKN